MTRNEKVKMIIAKSTTEKQVAKAREELQELLDALMDGNIEHIAEEIADVYIILSELLRIYEIPESYLDAIIDYKLERTLYRMERGVE